MGAITNSTKYTGSDFVLALNLDGIAYKDVAYSKSHTIEISADSRDISSKNDGDWKATAAGKKGYNVNLESLTIFDDAAANYEALYKKFVSKEPIKFISYLTNDKTTHDYTDETAAKAAAVSESFYFTGTVNITSMSAPFSHGETLTFSATLEGQGELELVHKS